MNACSTSRHMDDSKDRTWNLTPSLIESRFALHCKVTDCKNQGTYMYLIKECYHYVCGRCLRTEEKFLIDGDKTKNIGYVCPVCIQMSSDHHSWVSKENIFVLLAEMFFCMQCISEEAVCRVNCGHRFCLECLKGEKGHPNSPIVCKVTDCSETIKKDEKDYLDRSISELMVWNKIKFPNHQRCHECYCYQAIFVLRQCGHGYCHSCVEKLKKHPDPERSIGLHTKILECTYPFCKTTLSDRILEKYLKLLQSKEKKIAISIELSTRGCYVCYSKNESEIRIRNKSCSHVLCKDCLFKNRKNVETSVSKENQKLESLVPCPAPCCKTTTPQLYLETIFNDIYEETSTADIFLRKSTLSEKCGYCKQKYACMTRLVCSHGICGTCAENEIKLRRTISECNESYCYNVIPVISISKFLQENSFLVALNYLETDHQRGCVSSSNAAEIGSTRSQKQRRTTSYEKEDTSREQTDTITMSNCENPLCEICQDLAVAVIGNCLHKYCLKCISVLLRDLPSDVESIQCVDKCETLICKRRLEQFSMTPMVKQTEMLMYFEVKPSTCGIGGCKNQGIIKARNCSHSFCLGCLQKCIPGDKCKGTACRSSNLPPNHHFRMLVTSLLSRTDKEVFPCNTIFTENESKNVHDDWICSCRSKGILKIVRCGHTMCKRCVKDCIKTVELTREQDNLTIARCNDSTCSEFFILPMCGAFENENEIEESGSEINQASMSSKRQNETETSDVGDAKTVITFQQETSSNSAASKKKRKLENDNGIGDDTKKTRNLDKENNTGKRKTELLGLPNVGFSCYRNCILQVLAETPYFLERLGSFINRRKGLSQEERNTWICHLQSVLVGIRTKSTEDHIEELHQFHHEFNKSNPGYREFVQEDCLSFLTTLLNGIQDAIQETRGSSINPAGIFHGKWKDKYKCLECSMEDFYNESEFFYLPLPYKEKKNGEATIGSCLLGLFEKEMVDLFSCSTCGHARMTKEVAIELFPTILVLQFSKLSEVDESNQDRSLRKKANFVRFWDQFNGLKNSELKKRIGKDTLKPYRLFGVVVHWGSERSGHYISFVKRKDRQNWQRCDDSYVRDASLDSVLESNAYLLFYEKCETQIE